MLVTALGHPVPPSDVVAALDAQKLRLEWGWDQCWHLFYRIADDHPRREFIRAGQLDPSCEWQIIGRLPKDCSADEALSYISKSIRETADPREIDRLLLGIAAHNEKQSAANMDQAFNENVERLVRTSSKRTGHFEFARATNELREEAESPRD